MTRAPLDWESRIGHRITLKDLHVLTQVSRCGSMAKAAAQMGTTQSVVSDSIAKLEAAVDVRLLDRSSRGVEPTVYAQALLRRSHVVFDELREAVRDIEGIADSTTGDVRIACPEFLAGGVVAEAVDSLSAAYPDIHCEVVEADANALEFRQLHERLVDLMVVRVPAAHVDDNLTIEVLFDDPHVVVAGVSSEWAGRTAVSLAELAGQPWVFPSSSIVLDIVSESFEAAGLRPPRAQVVSPFLLMRNRLLSSGRFLSVLPVSVLGHDADRAGLCALPVHLKTRARPVAIVTLQHRSASPAMKLFGERLRRAAKRYASPPSSTP